MVASNKGQASAEFVVVEKWELTDGDGSVAFTPEQMRFIVNKYLKHHGLPQVQAAVTNGKPTMRGASTS
jgi:hypothetical protein